jgi:hypothetical protein
MKRSVSLATVVVLLAVLVWLERSATIDPGFGAANTAVAEAYRSQLSDLWVEGEGRVLRVLSDDNDGSRHQRFVLEVGPGHTVLVAHNIDLAPRLDSLRRGDVVRFVGEYVWNDRGGIIHWTHHDPAGRHAGGWLEHSGRSYR